ncbi:MAG: amidase [Ardenticatenaceae bacterium]|nr:amidase [Ardenticatenaceae bacterium]
MNDLCFLPATELAQRIQRKELSAREVMAAHLAQIEKVNPHVNAIVTLLPEQAMAAAAAADEAQARGEPLGPLHGLPIAHKDLANTKGIRTTFGSPILKDNVPDFNDLIIDRLQGAGALTIGKTNTPEFGAGSQTFNRVFGATRNPYDLGKTCGGSSGGAAVSLATGMIPIADGSDMGGSLRNPANYCNIVGMRVSPGRVPDYPKLLGWGTLGVVGPMARTVSDVALLLTAIAGPDRRDPLSIQQPGSLFAQPLARDFRGTKVAWSLDLGELPVDGRVTAVLASQRHIFTDLGLELAEKMPDWRGADEAFKVGRALSFAHSMAPLLENHRDQLKQTIIWNAESGLKLSALDYARAEEQRTALYHRVREFMEEYEYLILPVSQVPPFDINQEFITEINGVQMETYIDWMKSCYYISATGLPAVSVPCGFTDDGLPVGVQIVGRHQDDFGVLQLAYAFEQATQVWRRRPEIGD